MGEPHLGHTPRLWLWLTVIFTGGGIVAAVALAPRASAPPLRGLAWLLFLGSSVHVASTGWLYTLADVRAYSAQRPLRYRWVPVGLVLGGAATAAIASPAQLSWLLLAYFAWQFFHFHRQNLGMAALAASSHRVAPLTPTERGALTVAGGSGIVGLMARPALIQLRVDTHIGFLFDAGEIVFAAAVLTGLVALGRRPAPDRPAGVGTVYAMALLFSLPVFVFSSPYAAVGGMTIAHGLQYLLLVGLIAGGGRRTTRLRAVVVLGNIGLVGGALLSGASHLHDAMPVVRLLFGAYLGVVMAHFVIDAGLWRMRDPFPRMFLARHLPALVPPRADVVLGHGSAADIR
ncbi:MAG TPA: hypothetical protein VMU64_13205 [Acidimicrobiales bacterium]|nr:hypothetical protein [Acidimicrobiales bacterium]